MTRVIALVALATLGGCAGASNVGQGPIKLSPQLEAAFQRYLAQPGPGAFAVSRTGRAGGGTACGEASCRGNEMQIALEGCRRYGEPCYLYAVGRNVVWRTDLPPPAE